MRKYAINSKPRQTFTAEQKAEYKRQKQDEQKALLEDAVSALTSSEAWTNWIKFGRSNLRKYSFNNALLIWSQKRDAKLVHGKVQWSKEDVELNDDAQPLTILAPVFGNEKDENGNIIYGSDGKPKKRVVFFRAVKVYDVSDTNAPETTDVQIMRDVEGDDLAEHLGELEGMAREMGIVVRFREDTGNAHGWYDAPNSEIVIKRDLSGNGIIRTLIHELCHAYGNVNYTDYSREEAEVLVESATVMALGMAGFDVSEASVPYIASWGGDLEVLKKNALLVETLVNDISERLGV
jgi:hypothetical protein